MASAADIGIDLGTSNVLIYAAGRGIVLRAARALCSMSRPLWRWNAIRARSAPSARRRTA